MKSAVGRSYQGTQPPLQGDEMRLATFQCLLLFSKDDIDCALDAGTKAELQACDEASKNR